MIFECVKDISQKVAAAVHTESCPYVCASVTQSQPKPTRSLLASTVDLFPFAPYFTYPNKQYSEKM